MTEDCVDWQSFSQPFERFTAVGGNDDDFAKKPQYQRINDNFKVKHNWRWKCFWWQDPEPPVPEWTGRGRQPSHLMLGSVLFLKPRRQLTAEQLAEDILKRRDQRYKSKNSHSRNSQMEKNESDKVDLTSCGLQKTGGLLIAVQYNLTKGTRHDRTN